MEMTRLQGGLHQAIEAKEGLKLTQETRAMASITYQNLFKMFRKLGGMTRTGKVAEAEFLIPMLCQWSRSQPIARRSAKICRMKSIRPCRRKSWLLWIMWRRSMKRVIRFWSLPDRLKCRFFIRIFFLREGIPHNLLNANNAPREAQIIRIRSKRSRDGCDLNGRSGTDIKLGPGVAELGELVVVGTERMMNQRIDLQFVTFRSSRRSRFDQVLRLFGRRFDENWGQTGSRIPIKTMMWMSGLVQQSSDQAQV